MITLLDKWCRTGQILFMDESFLEALAKPEPVGVIYTYMSAQKMR